ncbi:MAG: transglutaminase domain-containing protein [Novosphingobium sp.]|nr:transglutaminase domain-containing protein [Novosphingobium sp.]
MPQPVASQLPDEPAVFGTVPVPIKVKPIGSRWLRIMRAPLDQPALVALTGSAWGMAREAQAAFVQSAVNRAVRNRSTSYDCADDGYWAPASETLGRGVGDCIDIAIAKMEALRLLGVPARDLYLTTGYAGAHASQRGRESAALLVRIGGNFWLLTDRNSQVIAASSGMSRPDFAPIITYGVGKTWIHGKPVKVTPEKMQTAALAGSARVAP